MEVRSVLRAGRALSPWRFLVLSSLRGWMDLRAIVRLDGLGKLRKFSDLIEKRTRDFLAYSIAPRSVWLSDPAAIWTENFPNTRVGQTRPDCHSCEFVAWMLSCQRQRNLQELFFSENELISGTWSRGMTSPSGFLCSAQWNSPCSKLYTGVHLRKLFLRNELNVTVTHGGTWKWNCAHFWVRYSIGDNWSASRLVALLHTKQLLVHVLHLGGMWSGRGDEES
jgi:hypothetical protein